MVHSFPRPAAIYMVVAIVVGALMAAAPGVAAVSSPFSALEGVWSGSGQVRFNSNRSERVLCKAYYNSKSRGAEMSFAIRCASSSYKIELRSQLSYAAGRVEGTWEERTYNTNGTVSGEASSGAIKLNFSGNVMGAMSVNFGGSQQRVLISAGDGTTNKPASIYLNLSRR